MSGTESNHRIETQQLCYFTIIFVFFSFQSLSGTRRYFSIPTIELPLLVQDHIKENRDSVRKNYVKKCDQNDNKKNTSPKRMDGRADATRYYQLKSNPSPQFITFVDRRDTFDEMLGYLLGQSFVAFDAEWNPIKTSSPELALIQFATNERIFLIDVISSDISPDDWNRLAINVFNNLEILKIGKRWPPLVRILFSFAHWKAAKLNVFCVRFSIFTTCRFETSAKTNAGLQCFRTNDAIVLRFTGILAKIESNSRIQVPIWRLVNVVQNAMHAINFC